MDVAICLRYGGDKMAKCKKYYAIKSGKNVKNLIVDTWDECKTYVNGVHAQYKSFKTKEEAELYLASNYIKSKETQKTESKEVKKTSTGSKKKRKQSNTVLVQSRVPKEIYEKFIERCDYLDVNKEKTFTNLIIESLEEWIED